MLPPLIDPTDPERSRREAEKWRNKLKECVKKGQDAVTPPSPTDVVNGGVNAMLSSLAEGVAKAVTDMVRVTMTGWLYAPSIQIDKDSGVVQVKPDVRQPDGKKGDELYNGGCMRPLPNVPLNTAPPSSGPVGSQPASVGPSTSSAPGGACDPKASSMSQISSLGVQGVMASIGALVAALLLIVQGMRTAFSRKGTHVMEAVRGLLVAAVMASAGLLLLNTLLVFSDLLTGWILDSSLSKGLEARVTTMMGLSVATLGPVPVILLGVVVFTIAVVQLVMLFIRQSAIPVLAMLMPVAAAGQVGGQISRQWLVRLWTSLFAIVLYKPLAALIFAVGFLETGQGQGIWDVIRGATTLVLAIFALPTLMKIFTPIVGQEVSIGSHNLSLSGFVSGFAEGGMAGFGLLGGGKSSEGKDGGDKGGGGVTPTDPAAYERVGLPGKEALGAGSVGSSSTAGAVGAAVPAVGGGLLLAEKAGEVANQAADRFDQAVAQGADAFIGGDGVAPAAGSSPNDAGSTSQPGSQQGLGDAAADLTPMPYDPRDDQEMDQRRQGPPEQGETSR
ncbi:hypothetical protein [Actinomadura kijaniata]|uniref:hypothetical protein n=1 Tax=Actinomadura kijaniata TaxID=46161 RepID=UPI00082A888B|nr:hypothetical protein [Actinomadura kijaniata]